MSLYNLINGVNQATFYILPLLDKHPDEYPRFRDCYLDDEEKNIVVYTRAGGGNREFYVDHINEIRAMPTYIDDCDDDFDFTYASFTFGVPSEWQDDFAKLKDGKLFACSDDYWSQLKKVYPKLAEKFDEIRNKISIQAMEGEA